MTRARATKRRKTQAQRYECHTCMVSRISSQFPDSNPTSTCEHMINTCKRCLKDWVESQIETSVFTPQIACPECEQKMGREDVEVAVTQKLFARYVKLERVYVAENTPGWRWCLAAGCGAGQIHVSGEVESEDGDDGSPGLSERIDSDDNHLEVPGSWSLRLNPPAKPDISKCNKCSAKACVPCDHPWHENESCEAYKLRTKNRTEEEDASLAAIQKETKPCPSCSKNILKTGGCKHMYCTQCRTEFCWDCMHLINQGNGQYCGCNGFRQEAPAEFAGPVAGDPGRIVWVPGMGAIPGALREELFD